MTLLQTCYSAFASNDVKMRRMVGYWALTMLLYTLCMGLLWVEVSLGVTAEIHARWLTAWVLAGGLLFYGLIRASRVLRIKFSWLAFAQALCSIIAVVAAYTFVAPVRGALISLLMGILIFCGFALDRQQSRLLSGLTVLLLALTMAVMQSLDPLGFPVGQEMVSFVIGASMIAAAAFLTGQFCALRQHLTSQKTELGNALKRIQLLATHDEMTGLANRMHMRDTLMRESQRHKREGQTLCLAMIDIDQFKSINDNYGHPAGDEILASFARYATGTLRVSDLLARWGGEEFCLMMPNTSLTAGMRVVERLRHEIGQLDLAHVDASLRLTFSAGLTAMAPGDSVAEVLRRADKAMYQAKGAGRDTVAFFDPEMEAGIVARMTLESELQEALRAQQFEVWYQPQLDAEGAVIGVEALLRWQHPRRGLVFPGEFIPLAEETGFIVPLGFAVLEIACKQLITWSQHAETAQLTISVNVSARQFRHADFLKRVLAMLDEFPFDPHRLILELTESMLVDDIESTIAKMSILKARGVSFSLDDFGTGYSSLAYLKRLPIDELKIDQSFVREVLTNSNDAVIARTIVALAHSLGLSVIAEGVESEGQRKFLIENGCLRFQGFLFSHALALESCNAFIRENRSLAEARTGAVAALGLASRMG